MEQKPRTVDSLFDISCDVVNKVKKQIGEEENHLHHLENLLDQWIQSEPHLPKNYDRQMVRNFIRGGKFNFQTVKRKLEGYFLAKYAFPDLYQNRRPTSQEISQAFESLDIVWLPKLTQNGARICFISVTDSDPTNFNMANNLKLFWMAYDFGLSRKFPIASEILIFDCLNLTPQHGPKILCMHLKNSISILKDAYAVRISQVHLINCSTIMEKIISAIRPWLLEKINKRFMVHKNTKTLLEHLELEVLPSDVGGDLNSVKSYAQQWKEALIENSKWFENQELVNICGTPPKQLNKFTRVEEGSLEGSFRQLNID